MGWSPDAVDVAADQFPVLIVGHQIPLDCKVYGPIQLIEHFGRFHALGNGIRPYVMASACSRKPACDIGRTLTLLIQLGRSLPRRLGMGSNDDQTGCGLRSGNARWCQYG